MRIASNLQFAFLSALRGSQEGVQFGNLQAIRANQAICANLSIDSRESGQSRKVVYVYCFFSRSVALCNRGSECSPLSRPEPRKSPKKIRKESGALWVPGPHPEGPKIEKIQDLPPDLKISSEIENFKRATHQGPI